jgi:hypothetical protein
MEDVTPERWLPVPGYEGLYEASSLGMVRSLDRIVRTRGRGTRLSPGRVLAFGTYDDGHKHVTFSRDGKTRTFTVHSVILAAFVGPRPEGMQIRHFPDRDPANNRLDNLLYGTAKENMEDRDDWHGTNYEMNLTHCPQDHPYDETNTYWYKGARQCRTCRNGGRIGPECSKDGCDRSARTRGLCQKHYIEWLRSQMSDEQRAAARAKDADRARQKRARSATAPG